VTAAVALFGFADPAAATFPGANGKIAFSSIRNVGDLEIYSMNSDGGSQTRLTNTPSTEANPTWSPDGTKIAFTTDRNEPNPHTCFYLSCNSEIYVMNADGSGQTRITNSAGPDWSPAWSPDGTQIAFTSARDGNYEIYVMNADGTAQTRLTNDPAWDAGADWSPNGQKIAFDRYPGDGNGEVYVMNADGTGQQNITNNSAYDSSASWSPDGSKIAFISDREDQTNQFFDIYTADATGQNATNVTQTPDVNEGDPVWSPDGTKLAFDRYIFVTTPDYDVYVMSSSGGDQQDITNKQRDDTEPDWQAVTTGAGSGFPRPKGATPFQTYLTVAYKQCLAPDEQHGAPLAVLSCNPPQQSSSFLTVGTLDANGQQAKAVGVYRLDVKGSPADVKITFALKDVRSKPDLSDYTGELRVTENWRITDQNNGPIGGGGGTDPGTNTDLDFPPLNVTCAATADTTVGSTCNATSSANAIVLGSIQAGKRMNSELGQVQVNDGGADGVAATEGDNTLFMDQGVFAP
jgi:Tol biopolymer transport system component